MRDEEIRQMADAIWEYIKNKHLKEYLSDSVCYYRATVTTAANNGTMGVTRPLDNEVFIPYASSAANLAVGDQCIVLVFGDASNSIVFGSGTLR